MRLQLRQETRRHSDVINETNHDYDFNCLKNKKKEKEKNKKKNKHLSI